jgi:hypothetical protein
MWGTPLERRHQTIRLRDRHWNPASIASFRRRRPDPYERNAAISWHFEHDPTPYALETDWPVGAAGFELLHLMRTRQDSPPRGRVSNLCISEFEFTETLSPGCRTRTCASMRKLVGFSGSDSDAQVRILPPQPGSLFPTRTKADRARNLSLRVIRIR